jgi:hypothetical protein
VSFFFKSRVINGIFIAAYKRKVKLKPFLTVIFVVCLPLISFASPKKEIIFGFGFGYSGALDATMQEWEYDYTEFNEMYFKERGKMKSNFSFYAQYFFNNRFGLELEFRQQNGSYFSHLEWYGRWMGELMLPENYLAINHIEDPYWEDWNVSSFTLSIMYAYRQYQGQKLYPYISVGLGFHFLNADEELVLNRWKSGPRKSGGCMKLDVGLKYRFSSKLALNLKIFGASLTRFARFGLTTYVGHDQFNIYAYLDDNTIVRSRGRNLTAGSFTYGGINLSLEFRL